MAERSDVAKLAIGDFFGESPAIIEVRRQVEFLLSRPVSGRPLPPVLILGETGTGKTLLARLIHRSGLRASGPFVDVSCAAIPETLLESVMFGSERGIHTDARERIGLFQAAHHGTIFLDEIGLLPEALQAKMLKVVEERSVRRLGSTRNEPVDVAIVTATNEDLIAATRERRFRADLYHRLAILKIELPPLRERGNDVLLLAERLLARASADYNLPRKTLDAGARSALRAYHWPGNVRELGNVIERVALLYDAPVVTAAMLEMREPRPVAPPSPPTTAPVVPAEASEDAERDYYRQVLEREGWNISRAADLLRISRNTLRYRIEKYGLKPGSPASPVRRPPAPSTAPPAPIGPVPTAIAPVLVATEPAQSPAGGGPGPSASTRIRWDPRRVTLLRAVLVPEATEGAPSHASRLPEMLIDKVQSFGGRVEELGPTGLVASFGLEWLEDAPRHAAHAATVMQNAAAQARRDGPAPHLKTGIHVGQLLIGDGGGAAQIDLETKREAIQLLDLLLAAGEADNVLVTGVAAPFLERSFDLEPLGLGESGNGTAFRLAGRPLGVPEFGRPIAPFVGRRHDLELLESRLTSTLAGRGQVVGIVGDAGLGKSRLVFEFRRALRRRDVTWLEGRGLSYGSSVPFLPIIQMLRQNFGITDVHGAETIPDRVRSGLGAVGMDADEWAPYLFQLLGVREGTERLAGLAPEAVRSRTLDAIRQLALHGSQRRPIVLVLEDLHWIDRTSEEVVNALVEALSGAPIMFIATYRPGYRPPWMDRSYATQIAIQPLSQEDSRSVMRAALRAKEVPDALAQQILDKAEGNPFFLEELAGSVRDQSDLGYALDAPDTVQEVLLARIHRLGGGPRRALQTAALFGRECALRVLRSIWSEPQDIETHLRELVRLEFIYEHSRGAEPVFVFKHPLTQEVAYTSLTGPERQKLHADAGRALETTYADRLPDAYEQLAHHYARSDRHDKALEYLTLLARKAVGLHAHDEAVRVLEEAQRHLHGLPASERERRRLDLVLWQASELIRLGRLKEIVETLLPQRDAIEHLGDSALSAQYHFVLCHAYSFLDRERSVWHAERAIAEADRCGDDIVKGKAYSVLGQDGPLAGRSPEGVAHGLKAVELLQTSEEHWWRGRAHWVVALNYCQTGAFDDASTAIAAADAIAESTGQPPLQAVVAWCTGIIHAARGEADASIQACRRGVECVRDPLNRAITTGWLGYALMEKGESGEAVARLDHVTRLLGQFGYRPLQAWFLAFLAEAHRLEGQLDLARDVAHKSLQIATDVQVQVAEGWARLALGRIAIDAGAHAEAEAHLAAARAAFAAVHSRYELARTEMDLAVATDAQGKKAEAHTHLDGAHALFGELNLTYHVRRAERLARDLGVSLSRR
jgi:DNA-binding NtrC family response regulator/tetratricopeptide (TPR) repeat protein